MPEESLGGKDWMDQEWSVTPDMAGKTMAAFYKEMEKMSKPLKLFRNMQQYQICQLRWAGTAIGARQWSWRAQMGHMDIMDIITKIAEKELRRMGPVAPYCAMVYCERRRFHWSERCKRGTPP